MNDRRDAWVELAPADAFREAVGKGDPYDFGFIPAMGRLLLAHPRIGSAFLPLFAQIMFGPGRLDRREREMIAAVAAAAQDCHY